jgi:N-acetylneuraminate synthase
MVERTFVIAEAGVNHNGSLDLALRLVDVAADAGADAVKFQTFKAGELATTAAARAQYQITNMGEQGTQLEMLRRLELDNAAHESLARHCERRQIRFMSTAFDAASLDFLAGFGMPAIKIPSGDVTCAPLLLQASRLGTPLIVSTGMCDLDDVRAALGVIAFGLTQPGFPAGRVTCDRAYASEAGREALQRKVTLLHCVTQYPTPPAAVNLRAMGTMTSEFGLPVGYSDHTLGYDVALAAVALGATVIEKHFTVDRSLPGPDHAASLEPGELQRMIAGIRTIELALGDGRKVPAEQELGNRNIARRSLVAAHAIRRGDLYTAESLAFKRPGHGVSPMNYWDVLGRRASRDFAADELIEL